MIRPDPAINALPWQKLIQEIGYILYKDSSTLERNINYYLKIHKLPETDPVKLQNLYNKLQREKNRFHYYTEIYFRLQNPNLVNMMNGIEEVFERQRFRNLLPQVRRTNASLLHAALSLCRTLSHPCTRAEILCPLHKRHRT